MSHVGTGGDYRGLVVWGAGTTGDMWSAHHTRASHRCLRPQGHHTPQPVTTSPQEAHQRPGKGPPLHGTGGRAARVARGPPEVTRGQPEALGMVWCGAHSPGVLRPRIRGAERPARNTRGFQRLAQFRGLKNRVFWSSCEGGLWNVACSVQRARSRGSEGTHASVKGTPVSNGNIVVSSCGRFALKEGSKNGSRGWVRMRPKTGPKSTAGEPCGTLGHLNITPGLRPSVAVSVSVSDFHAVLNAWNHRKRAECGV